MMESDICKIFEGVFFKIRIRIRFFEQVSFMLSTKFSKLRCRGAFQKIMAHFLKIRATFQAARGCIFKDPAHFLPKIKVQLLSSRPRFFAELFMIKVNSFLIATFIDQGSFLTFGISFYHDFYFLSGHFLIFDLPFYKLQFALTIKDSDFSLSSFRDFS